jgi:hypothetical protein
VDLLIDEEKSSGERTRGAAREKRTETAEEKENQGNSGIARKRRSSSKSSKTKVKHAPDILVIDGSDYVGEYVE